ncbi:MAG: hypothetical protein WCD35_00440 [Mycobacteriales bacterium]
MLAIRPCLSLCDWAATRTVLGGEQVFACRGCGSQWVRSEPWAPRQADGTVPTGVLEELRAVRSQD